MFAPTPKSRTLGRRVTGMPTEFREASERLSARLSERISEGTEGSFHDEDEDDIDDNDDDPCANRWQHALRLLQRRKLKHPNWRPSSQWKEHKLQERPTERCVRWDYGARSSTPAAAACARAAHRTRLCPAAAQTRPGTRGKSR